MIAYAMLYSVAVGVPVLLAALVVATVLQRYGRPERGVWLGALALSFGVPIAALMQTQSGPVVEGAATGAATTGVIGLPEVFVMPAAPFIIGLTEVLVGVWILWSLALALRWMFASLRLGRARRNWRPSTLDGVAVSMTDGPGPAVAGVLRPRVLVPPWLASMSTHRRSLVLLHEQEHIRARDPWLNVMSRLAVVLVPWNPVVWILASRLRLAIELDCDRRVLRHRPDVRAYGTTLLEVSSRDSGRLVAVAAFAESEAPLRNRILSMTTPSRSVPRLARVASVVLGILLMVGACEVPVPAMPDEAAFAPERASASGAPSQTESAARPGPSDSVAEPVVEPSSTAVGRPPEDPPEGPPERPVVRGGHPVAAEPGQVEANEPVPVSRDPSAEPTFTPFTVAPRLTNLDEVQQALVREYPTVLRDAGIGGRVEIWFFIDANGSVARTLINVSSGVDALDQAAMNVASIYRFSPALNRENRVPVWVSLPITFQVR